MTTLIKTTEFYCQAKASSRNKTLEKNVSTTTTRHHSYHPPVNDHAWSIEASLDKTDDGNDHSPECSFMRPVC